MEHLEDLDTTIIQYVSELIVELRARRDKWETGSSHSISKASLDQISRSISPVLGASGFQFSHVIASHMLLTIINACGSNLKVPFQHITTIAEAYTQRLEREKVAGVIYPPHMCLLAQKYDASVAWMRTWPGQAMRYSAIRNVDSSHPLAGLHRDMWKHFDMPINAKENIFKNYAHLPNHEGDLQARLKYSKEFIMPPEDPNFLRKTNPLVPGKLALNLFFLHTEVGLHFATYYCQLFCMCHLYNALRQLGYLDIAWPILDHVMKVHVSELFLGQVPTESARSIATRAFLACGASPELFRSLGSNGGRREKNYDKLVAKCTNKSGAFIWSPMMSIVADHLHDREPLRRTLLRLDAEMVAQESKATGRSNTKSLLENSDPVAFLERLRNNFRHFNRYLRVDYHDLVRICGGLFVVMVPNEEMKKAHWGQNPHTADLCAVLSILGELTVLSEMARPGTPAPRSAIATHIAGVLKNYIQGRINVAEIRGKFKYRES